MKSYLLGAVVAVTTILSIYNLNRTSDIELNQARMKREQKNLWLDQFKYNEIIGKTFFISGQWQTNTLPIKEKE